MKVYIDISQIVKANWYIKNKIGSSRSLSKLVDDNIGNIIFEISKQYKVSDIILAEDSKTYFRKSLYPLYKGHRIVDESYNDLKSKTILDLREIYNHKVYEGLEADDIMYLETAHNPGIIVSSDQDLRQTNQIIFNPVTKLQVIYRHTNKDLILKIIRGCSSDNVPKLINRFKSKLVHQNDPVKETCLQFVTEKEYSLNYELVVFDMTTYLKYVDLKNYKK